MPINSAADPGLLTPTTCSFLCTLLPSSSSPVGAQVYLDEWSYWDRRSHVTYYQIFIYGTT